MRCRALSRHTRHNCDPAGFRLSAFNVAHTRGSRWRDSCKIIDLVSAMRTRRRGAGGGWDARGVFVVLAALWGGASCHDGWASVQSSHVCVSARRSLVIVPSGASIASCAASLGCRAGASRALFALACSHARSGDARQSRRSAVVHVASHTSSHMHACVCVCTWSLALVSSVGVGLVARRAVRRACCCVVGFICARVAVWSLGGF